MAFTVTIDGDPVEVLDQSLNITAANGRSTATFEARSLDGSTRYDEDTEVIIEEDATRILGAVASSTRERGTVNGATDGIVIEVTGTDFNAFIDRRIVSFSLVSGTLKTALDYIVDTYLSGAGGYSITLDAGQVDGPTLPALAYTVVKLRDVLDDISRLTGEVGEPYYISIDDFRVLSGKQASTEPAPFDVADPCAEVIGDIVVEERRDSNYANNVTVYVPPTPQSNHVETFTGDGSEDTFQLQYTLVQAPASVYVDGVPESLAIEGQGFDLAVRWLYNQTNNTIQRVIQGVSDPPGLGADISITFDGLITIVVNAFDAAEIAAIGIWDKVITLSSLPPDTTAQAIADAELAKSKYPVRTVTYSTMEQGLKTGQSQTFTVSRRNLSGAAGVITQIVTRDIGKQRLLRQVTATIDDSQTNVGKSWGDVYRRWNGPGSLPAGGGTGSVGTGSPSAPPRFIVRKTSDTARTSTTTLTDDPHLVFQIAADEAYQWECMVIYTAANGAMDGKIGVSGPTGSLILWGVEGSNSQWEPVGTGGAPTQLLENAGSVSFGTSGSGAPDPRGIVLKGTIQNGSTAGTFAIRWSQNTSDAGALTFKTNSNLWYEKLP
jgi:hypothetical protein